MQGRGIACGEVKVLKSFFLCVSWEYAKGQSCDQGGNVFEAHFICWMTLNSLIALRLEVERSNNCNCKKRKGWSSYQGLFYYQDRRGELWLMTIAAALMSIFSTSRYRTCNFFPSSADHQWQKKHNFFHFQPILYTEKDTGQLLFSKTNAEWTSSKILMCCWKFKLDGHDSVQPTGLISWQLLQDTPICRQNSLCEGEEDCSLQANASKGQRENNSLSPCYRGQVAVKAVHYWQALFVAVFNSIHSSDLQPPRQHSSCSCWHLPPNQVVDYLVLINRRLCFMKSLSWSTFLPCNKVAEVWIKFVVH